MPRILRAGGLMRGGSGGLLPTVRRHHESLAHTADVGLRATGANLPALFEEAALALAELMAEGGGAGGTVPSSAGRGEDVALEADDPVGLAYAWLNELIGRAQAAGEALGRTEVERVEALPGGSGWRLAGLAWFVPYGEGADGTVRPRHDVKSATYHRLSVRRQRGGWTLAAYLDI